MFARENTQNVYHANRRMSTKIAFTKVCRRISDESSFIYHSTTHNSMFQYVWRLFSSEYHVPIFRFPIKLIFSARMRLNTFPFAFFSKTICITNAVLWTVSCTPRVRDTERGFSLCTVYAVLTKNTIYNIHSYLDTTNTLNKIGTTKIFYKLNY